METQIVVALIAAAAAMFAAGQSTLSSIINKRAAERAAERAADLEARKWLLDIIEMLQAENSRLNEALRNCREDKGA